MATLVTTDEFRTWAGASSANVPDDIVVQVLDEAEASILSDLSVEMEQIEASAEAIVTARGEELRRAQRGLARRHSPEGLAGMGELGYIAVPARDPDSAWALWRLREILDLPMGVA